MTGLLGWYDGHRRDLPWRARPGQLPDPYHVWLSEIMLQQTSVVAAGPYFTRFLARFATVQALAEADQDAVLQEWAGLGYYARARNLHAAARLVAAAGAFPADEAGWRALPGVGAYTARAIAAIAYGQPGIAVDGNVERVLARLGAIRTSMPAAKREIREWADWLAATPAARARPGDAVQALFDLGAGPCRVGTPDCPACPWADACAGRAIAAQLPARAARVARPVRYGVAFCLADGAGRVVLRRRPPHGLLGGMAELPGSAWRADPFSPDEIRALAPDVPSWREAPMVRHVFTHFELLLVVWAARVGAWPGLADPAAAALPSVMRKCVTAGLASLADAG